MLLRNGIDRFHQRAKEVGDTITTTPMVSLTCGQRLGVGIRAIAQLRNRFITASRVSTSALLFSTRTVATETPAWRATSRMVIILTTFMLIAAVTDTPCLARRLFWQRARGLREWLTRMETVTSILLMIVIQIVIWMCFNDVPAARVN
jgi:hypothetical protein